ncbi:MAG TPA: peptide chain release factor H [Burkholderiaceae bacterium]|nr:peptide chain release factor H [Burkholderiaceae bacterium]
MILLQLSANTGPEECCLAVRLALRVVLSECAEAGVTVELLEDVPAQVAGNLRSVLLALEGPAAQTVAQRWEGSMLWTCPSPYRSGHARKNWFIGGAVFEPGAQEDPVQDKDLRFETLRASGPGGQHVNKTDSAVRLTHLPTGVSVKVQTERSQHANKRLARALLVHKLSQNADQHAQVARAARRVAHREVERGNPVRVFKGVLFEELGPQAVMAGG